MFIIGVGSVTDDEFNSLRTSGINRPISIIEIIKQAKAEARSTHVKQIRKFLTPKPFIGISVSNNALNCYFLHSFQRFKNS